MWPMLYRANRDQIRDPDLIFPKQIFAIPRGYSREEADMAIHRARKRGPWRLGDGPDVYILEGVRP
ncbi:MAG: LysM peptidoglycan-binding domain-containing protein [Methyloligellaceae bacterium]